MIAETKNRIVEAAIETFNSDLSAPLQKVADRADVTRRTLHRYFSDREELVAFCEHEMEVSCKKAMITAIKSSSESLAQLENMLYAGVDCGAKYSFFHKLHQREGHNHSKSNEDCVDYDFIYKSFNKIIKDLQNEGIIRKDMPISWIQSLHTGIISSTVNVKDGSNLNIEKIKEFAWTSFLNGIKK
ncbi:MAG: TetR/AcrR family transcriptional regulator [Bacteroidota bacterium]